LAQKGFPRNGNCFLHGDHAKGLQTVHKQMTSNAQTFTSFLQVFLLFFNSFAVCMCVNAAKAWQSRVRRRFQRSITRQKIHARVSNLRIRL
jgi:hypothetical protein